MEGHGEGIQHVPVPMGSCGRGERDGLVLQCWCVLQPPALAGVGLAEGYGGSGTWQWDVVAMGCGGSGMWWQRDMMAVGCDGRGTW